MQIIGQLDPSLGPNSFPTGSAARGGVVILHNLSQYDLRLIFNNQPERSALLFGWQQRQFDFCGAQTNDISYQILPHASTQINPPSTIIIGEAYAPGEPVPVSLPNYDRFSNVGNQTLPTASSPAIINDGNSPNTEIIESTPIDQTVSSFDLTNDGSGVWQVLSAGAVRNVISVMRGNAIGNPAVITIGDENDPTLLTMHGTADSAATSGQAQTAITAISSLQVTMFDGSQSVTNNVNCYEGLTDPSTYIIPNEGDLWFDG